MTKLVFIFLFILPIACIKQDGKIPAPNAVVTQPPEENGIGTGTDPLASQAWHLKNTGQNSFSTNLGYGRSIAGHDIDIEGVLDLGISGRGVRIAISDTGVETEHLDLKANQLEGEHRNYGLMDQGDWYGGDPYPVNQSNTVAGHGTSVTGLAAAVGWNGIGSRGVAPHAKYAAFKYLIDYGALPQSSILARTIDQTDGDFDVFNYSYGYSQCTYHVEDSTVNESIEAGVKGLRDGKGALYVQSSGNSYSGSVSACVGFAVPGNPVYLGNTNFNSDLTSPYKIIVAAVNAQGLSSSYSSPGSGLWVSAPGGEYGTNAPAMVTTDLSGCSNGFSFGNAALNDFNGGRDTMNFGCNYNSNMNGTSSAAPVTTGTIALMLQANPQLTWRDVKHILAETAEVIDNTTFTPLDHPLSDTLPIGYDYDFQWLPNGTGKMFSNWYGFGRINALAAVLMAKTYNLNLGTFVETKNPRNGKWYYSSEPLMEEIPDNNAAGISSTINVLHNFTVESVQVQFTTDHPYPSDLAVHLISPSGRASRLLLMNSHTYATALPEDKDLLTNFFYGEESRGNWTLRVFDGAPGSVGNLTNWKIKINGHKVTPDGSSPDPVYNLTMPATYPSGRTSPVATFIPSMSPDLARYEISVGTSPGASNVVPWESVGIVTSIQVENMSLTTNRFYYLNVRAVDDRENVSQIQYTMWRTTF